MQQEVRSKVAFDSGEPGSQAKVIASSTSRRMAGPLGITFFRLIAEHGSDVASLHSKDGTCAYAAQSIERAFGWKPDDIVGRPLAEFVHPDDLHRVAEAFMVEGDAIGQVTYRLRKKSGEHCWVETLTQATPVPGDRLIVCMTRDASRQKRAALALEEGLLSLAMKTPDGVFIVQDGRILHANPTALAQLGLAAEAAVQGRRLADLIHPEDVAGESLALGLVEQGGSPMPVHDLRLLRRDGTVIPAQSYAIAVSFADRGAAMVVVREKPRPDTQAIVADRLRSIGTVAAGLAYELADPVALLLTSLDLLAVEDADESTLKVKAEALEQARTSGTRIYEALRSLRAFSRGDEDLRRAVDVREVTDAVLNVMQGRLSSTTRVVREFADVPTIVDADQARLSQALFNLISNAVDAANARELGEVRVAISVGTKGGALIEISDNGPGIEGNVLDRVFEPFFTTKPIATASGLGLPISHAIVSSLGGRLALESAPGAGTVALVQLPPSAARVRATSLAPRSTIRVAPAPPSQNRMRAMPRVAPQGERARLLILDDEISLAATLQRLFRHEYDVVVEGTAEGALRRVVAGERFDAILCDLLLPGMSGIEFYGELQRTAPELVSRVVFVTGGVITPGAQAFLDALPNLCVDKPFMPDELRQKLRELFGSLPRVSDA